LKKGGRRGKGLYSNRFRKFIPWIHTELWLGITFQSPELLQSLLYVLGYNQMTGGTRMKSINDMRAIKPRGNVPEMVFQTVSVAVEFLN
jgi:hypothetical protein